MPVSQQTLIMYLESRSSWKNAAHVDRDLAATSIHEVAFEEDEEAQMTGRELKDGEGSTKKVDAAVSLPEAVVGP